ncbi:2-aminoethylphosphonate--pyruvate transaminase, partial [Pseudomonas sp.]|uniref:2-aminoethylphosphonate--pyruvate transaminase n=1 Tax=Pseudomonas sp. TaxID=306 RepID=UPI00259089BC
ASQAGAGSPLASVIYGLQLMARHKRPGPLLVYGDGTIGHLVARCAHALLGPDSPVLLIHNSLSGLQWSQHHALAHTRCLLRDDPSITHVALIHCETSTGILNPLPEIAQVVARHGKRLIIDAMSSFGALPIDASQVPFDALIAASGKCLEGVPGMGFVFAHKAALAQAEGNCHSLAMDLHDQHAYMAKTGQWRFTPPTHVVAALHEALLQYNEEGGLSARHARYADNCQALLDGMAALGLRSFLPAAIQAPIIVTFHAPRDARYRFKDFYERVKAKGFILYPGKLTQVETFRVGCIGCVDRSGMQAAVDAVAQVLREMEVLDI